MRQDPVAVDVRQLSSGTMGKLIGKADYVSIDKAQAEFLAWVMERPGQFKSWKDAWAAYRPSWVVQDVFSGGRGGPGYRVFATLDQASQYSRENPESSSPFPAKECETCGSLLGLDALPLQGGCNECR